ncbi:hypothetical protein [Delftia sp. WSY_14]|uniref:hypothetical protein n=1 Tax=unclassified Delftia TaxID=2613839 RepID=UPI00370B0000
MFDFLPCSPAAPVECPTPFALRVSGWIDASNIGDAAIDAPHVPPGGMRLRWNCPFLNPDPTARIGYPNRFKIYRTDNLVGHGLFEPKPNCGQIPRTIAPPSFWHNALRTSDRTYVVGIAACDYADGVYIELSSRAQPLRIALSDTSGQRRITAELTPGAKFYYEMAGLHSVTFSHPPALAAPMQVLHLHGNLKGLDARLLATIDARAWVNSDLGVISERFANSAGHSSVSLDANDWQMLRTAGDRVIQAHDTGLPVPRQELDSLNARAAMRWEAALLMGWGFMDGEHPASPAVDQIAIPLMMPKGTKGIFGYQIIAEFDDSAAIPARTALSNPFFVSASPLASLSPPRAKLLSAPVAEGRWVNEVTPGSVPYQPTFDSKGQETVQCQVAYELETENTANERVLLTPTASASAITGTSFEPIGDLGAGAGDPPTFISGFVAVSERWLDFEIPFYDSVVGAGVTVRDAWDRRLACPGLAPLAPSIKYYGLPPSLESAKCDGVSGLATLALASIPRWSADALATHMRGDITLLARNPKVTQAEVSLRIGPPFLQTRGRWGAIMSASQSAEVQAQLVNGMLMAGGYLYRILGFFYSSAGEPICTFEANAQCAGEGLYSVAHGWIDAVMREADGSERLWVPVSEIGIGPDGLPAVGAKSFLISTFAHPTYSTTFWFATRVTLAFQGQRFNGPISPAVPAPYIHSPPPDVTACCTVKQIGVDYYGRGFVQIEATTCDSFDSGLHISVIRAASNVQGQDELSRLRVPGIFGPQSTHLETVLFQGFSELAQARDGGDFTLGLASHRPQDGAESKPALKTFLVRKVER